MTLIFGVTGLTQVVVLLVQGQFTGGRLLGSLVASVPVVASIVLGLRLRRRLAGPVFEKVVLAVLLLSATALLLDAIS